jgi:hypothetical protein
VSFASTSWITQIVGKWWTGKNYWSSVKVPSSVATMNVPCSKGRESPSQEIKRLPWRFLSGLSMLLFRQTFHPFSNFSHCNTDFNSVTTAFSTERAQMGCSDATIRGKQTIMKKDGIFNPFKFRKAPRIDRKYSGMCNSCLLRYTLFCIDL